ncbi:MAG: AMP-binding protein [Acidimicrobiales bacterium]
MLAEVRDRQRALDGRFVQWTPRTLDEMLDRTADEFGDQPYVITDERTFSYADVQEWSVRIARGLRDIGVRAGEHVAVVMANYAEFVALKFGIARIGAVAVPINFLNRKDELGYVLHQSDAVALVTMDTFRDLDYLGALDELAPGWESGGGGEALPLLRRVVVFPTGTAPVRAAAMSFAQLAATAAGWEPLESSDPSAPADILYTSGTTGSPKGVILTHDMLLRTAYGSAYGRAFQLGRRILFSLPMYHVYGYVEGMLAVLFVGGAIIPQITFSAADTLRGISEHRADDVLLVPTMTLAVLDAARRGSYDLTSLTAVISSGGQAPPGIWDEIFDLLGPEEVTAGYGMSETTASTTVTRPDDPRERLADTNGRLRDVGIAGDPDRGGRLAVYRVADPESGKVLERGEVGELEVSGIGVTSGYYKKPDETAAAFTEDGWLRTGDLGRIDEDDYLTLVGRKKDCYRCGGEQVVPKEIEDVLTTHDAVAQAHVVPFPDPRMGEVGVAWIVAREGKVVNAQELIAYCAERLARFKVPRHVLEIAADEVPLTPSGRPRKFLLAERAAAELGPR